MKNDRTVLCVGELLIDFFCTDIDVNLAKGQHFSKQAGGAPANVSAAVAKLGGKASFLGKIGADPFGIYLKQTLEEQHVDTSMLLLIRKHRLHWPLFPLPLTANEISYSTAELTVSCLCRTLIENGLDRLPFCILARQRPCSPILSGKRICLYWTKRKPMGNLPPLIPITGGTSGKIGWRSL